MRARVDELLADPGLPNPLGGSIAMTAGNGRRRSCWIRDCRPSCGRWRDGELAGSSDAELLPQPNPEVFGAYVEDLLAIDPRALRRRPLDLAKLLTDPRPWLAADSRGSKSQRRRERR